MAFWGLVVQPAKSYTQTVDMPFHVSMACLGEKPLPGRHTLILTDGASGEDFVLCHLSADKTEQQQLDLSFAEGEEITIKMVGPSPIHLTGTYIIDEPSGLSDFDDESIDSDGIGMSDEEDDEEEDSESELLADGKIKELDGEDDDSDESGEGESDEEMSAEEAPKPAAKKQQQQQQQKASEAKRKADAEPAKPETKKAKTEPAAASAKGTPAPAKKEAQSAKATPAANQKAQESKPASAKTDVGKAQQQNQKSAQATPSPADGADKTPKKKTLPSGLTIDDKVVGSGAKAKKGKTLAVRYIGKLDNGKVFDSNTNGSPFKLQLGKGSVIKGWDIGLEGMNQGGTRVLTIPPNLAYGAKGAPPDIPPNSTLTFEIKLLTVD